MFHHRATVEQWRWAWQQAVMVVATPCSFIARRISDTYQLLLRCAREDSVSPQSEILP